MRAVWDLIGWEGLSPGQQYAAFAGAFIGLLLGLYLMFALQTLVAVLFGGRSLNRRTSKPKPRKGKGRKGRRR